MGLSQQKFREIVFQLVFSANQAGSEDEDMVPFMMHQFVMSKKAVRLAQERKALVVEKLPEIDARLKDTSLEYELERMGDVERNILRLGCYELLYSDVPPKVVIAEALRLSRKYASREAAGFVNAILDKLIHASKV